MSNPTNAPMLRHALDLLTEAAEMQSQNLQLSGAVTPESPGGQLTATRRDGKKVDRTAFMKEALRNAQIALMMTQGRQSRGDPLTKVLVAAAKGETIQQGVSGSHGYWQDLSGYPLPDLIEFLTMYASRDYRVKPAPLQFTIPVIGSDGATMAARVHISVDPDTYVVVDHKTEIVK
jgi:hypothetical protein